MQKPNKMQVGQIWKYENGHDMIEYRVHHINECDQIRSVFVEIIRSSYRTDIGSVRYASENSFLTLNSCTYIGGGSEPSKRKRSKLWIVMCRGCGSKNDWVKGTSKKNYLCMPCRGQE